MNLLVGGKCAPKTPKRWKKQLIIPLPWLGRMDADQIQRVFSGAASRPVSSQETPGLAA
jgi:hypothetical protein